ISLWSHPVLGQPTRRTPTAAFDTKVKSGIERGAINPSLSAGNDFQQSVRALSATPLARPALSADAAGAGANYFVATAMGADDVHEHVAERFFYSLCVCVARGDCSRVSFPGG